MSAYARTAPVPFVPHGVLVFLYYTHNTGTRRRCTDTTTILRPYCSRSGETRISNDEEAAMVFIIIVIPSFVHSRLSVARDLHVCFLTGVALKQSARRTRDKWGSYVVPYIDVSSRRPNVVYSPRRALSFLSPSVNLSTSRRKPMARNS